MNEITKAKRLRKDILKLKFTCGYWVPIRVKVCKAWVCNVLVNGFATFICAGSNRQPIRMGTKSCNTNRPIKCFIIQNECLSGTISK